MLQTIIGACFSPFLPLASEKTRVLVYQAPEMGLLAPDLVLYLDIPPEVICSIFMVLKLL